MEESSPQGPGAPRKDGRPSVREVCHQVYGYARLSTRRHPRPILSTRYPEPGTQLSNPVLALQPRREPSALGLSLLKPNRDPVVFVDDSGDSEAAGLGPVGDRRLVTAEQAGEGE